MALHGFDHAAGALGAQPQHRVDDSTDGLAPTQGSARLRLRMQSQKLIRQPHNALAHVARVEAAVQMDGTEAVQGALADMFAQLDSGFADAKRGAYQFCQHRLPPRIAAAFEALIGQGRLPFVNHLATRWSLLSIPSADMPARTRRCSLDDSRTLAAQGVLAFEARDETAQQVFLNHCLACHDKMAFMLARRSVLKLARQLPTHWEAVSSQLEAL